jgi:hypothetical protein
VHYHWHLADAKFNLLSPSLFSRFDNLLAVTLHDRCMSTAQLSLPLATQIGIGDSETGVQLFRIRIFESQSACGPPWITQFLAFFAAATSIKHLEGMALPADI